MHADSKLVIVVHGLKHNNSVTMGPLREDFDSPERLAMHQKENIFVFSNYENYRVNI